MSTRRVLPWLLALLLGLAFAFQGTRGLWEPDEGRYSSAGINMHESGDWLIPSIDGEHPHLTKPPITYWALASSFALLGHNEWAARLPSALAFVGTGLFVLGLGRRLCRERPWLPAAVWALSLAPVIAANIVSTDPILTLFETAAMYAFVEAWSREGRDARRWFIAMWVAWGLAFMTKGPPGLLPLLAMIVFLAWRDRARLRAMFTPVGVLLFLVTALTWFGVVIAQEPSRLRYFLGYEVYDRMFTSVHNRNSQWYGGFEVYVPVLLFGMLPWWPIALKAAGGPRAAWTRLRRAIRARDAQWLLLLCWFAIPFAVFFLAKSRLQLYILPLMVPLAIAMARPIARWPAFTGTLVRSALVASAVALLAFKAVLSYIPHDRDARALAAQVHRLIRPADYNRLAFIDMKPFYGLNLYLDHNAEEVLTGVRASPYLAYASIDALCPELHDNDVYFVKRHHVPKFAAASRACGSAIQRLGSVHADGTDIELFRSSTGPG
jgi:4-amino-4-deoxy-L-arabinose transferase